MEVDGRSADEVLAALDSLTADDGDFAGGRVFGLVFHAGHDVEEVARKAHDRFVWHNALNPDVFPSLRKMTSDLVASMAWLLSGRGGAGVDPPVGFLTSGGTESILMAVKAAKKRGGLPAGRGNVVLPMSAHAAFSKGCEYFGLEERRVPVGPDWRADVDAMADACDDDTVLLVGSAPQYPQGVIDPIASIAALALDRDVHCHVDACMGGLVLPFIDGLEPWDFRVPGVTTISADIHKYGYVPKGISVILHRDRESRSRQVFHTDNWLGGSYGSSGILGTKPGGPIAAGWAVFQYLGVSGYERLVAQAVRARQRMEAGVRAVPGLTVLGRPDATLLAIAGEGEGVDVFAVDVGLASRGWRLDRQGPPDSLHATLTPIQEATVDAFLADLREVAASAGSVDDRSTNYAKTE